MSTNNPKLSADDIHNWSAPYVVHRWRQYGLTETQKTLIASAELNHHRRGEDAQELADALNKLFGWK